jgi:hypothetical protein
MSIPSEIWLMKVVPLLNGILDVDKLFTVFLGSRDLNYVIKDTLPSDIKDIWDAFFDDDHPLVTFADVDGHANIVSRFSPIKARFSTLCMKTKVNFLRKQNLELVRNFRNLYVSSRADHGTPMERVFPNVQHISFETVNDFIGYGLHGLPPVESITLWSGMYCVDNWKAAMGSPELRIDLNRLIPRSCKRFIAKKEDYFTDRLPARINWLMQFGAHTKVLRDIRLMFSGDHSVACKALRTIGLPGSSFRNVFFEDIPHTVFVSSNGTLLAASLAKDSPVERLVLKFIHNHGDDFRGAVVMGNDITVIDEARIAGPFRMKIVLEKRYKKLVIDGCLARLSVSPHFLDNGRSSPFPNSEDAGTSIVIGVSNVVVDQHMPRYLLGYDRLVWDIDVVQNGNDGVRDPFRIVHCPVPTNDIVTRFIVVKHTKRFPIEVLFHECEFINVQEITFAPELATFGYFDDDIQIKIDAKTFKAIIASEMRI